MQESKRRMILNSSYILLYLLIQLPLSHLDQLQDCPSGCSCESTDRILNPSRTDSSCTRCIDLCGEACILDVFACRTCGGVENCQLCRGSQSGGDRVKCIGSNIYDLTSITFSRQVLQLDISENHISNLKKSVFSDKLLQLRSVSFKSNNIAEVEFDSFRRLRFLEVLNLSSNNLSKINTATFSGLDSLQTLDLSINKISSVEGLFLSELHQLSRLDLSNNNIRELTRSSFKGLSGLRNLLVADNQLIHIDRRTFRHLKNLVYLVLKGNKGLGGVIESNGFHFHPSSSLTYLDLSDCGLRDVPRGMPDSTRYLQLRRNNITALTKRSFSECPHVYTLVLDDNNIMSIENGSLEVLDKLQQLWLNNNSLRDIPLSPGPNMERLLLDFNQIQQIKEIIPKSSISQLNTFSVMGNNISFISPRAFVHLPYLDSLQLSNNSIRELQGEIFSKLSELRSLDLSNNPCEIFHSRCFSGLRSLRELYLSYISHKVKINELVLNDITNISLLELDSSPHLASTLFDSNFDALALPFVPPAENSQSVLRRKREATITESSSGNKLLQSRHLRRSVKSHNDESRIIFSNLSDLNVRGSSLTSVRSDLLRLMPSLKTLQISSDRWHCDKDVRYLRDWLVSTGDQLRVTDGHQLQCATPLNFRGRQILSLTDEELHVSSATSGAPDLKLSSKSKFSWLSNNSTVTSSIVTTLISNEATTISQIKETASAIFTTSPLTTAQSTSSNSTTVSQSSQIKETAGMSTLLIKESSAADWVITNSNLSKGEPELENFLYQSDDTTIRRSFTSKNADPHLTQENQEGVQLPAGLPLISFVILTVTITIIAIIVLIAVILFLTVIRPARKSTGTGIPHSSTSLLLAKNLQCTDPLGKKRTSQSLGAIHGIRDGWSTDHVKFDQGVRMSKSTVDIVSRISCKDGKMNGVSSADVLTLVPGRDMNHEGPLRVYNWEDF